MDYIKTSWKTYDYNWFVVPCTYKLTCHYLNMRSIILLNYIIDASNSIKLDIKKKMSSKFYHEFFLFI